MIRTDGDRSLKRRWFAKKKLAQIIDMDMQGKTVALDGFTIGVSQQDGIGKGYIRAPMGLRVHCANYDTINCFNADYWLGGFDNKYALFSLDNRCDPYELRLTTLNNEDCGSIRKTAGMLYADGRPYEYMDGEGETVMAVATDNSVIPQDITEYNLCRLHPYRYADYYTTYLGVAVYAKALVGAPVSIPFAGSEGCITINNINKAYSSDSTLRSNTCEICLNRYGANGSQKNRRSVTIEKDNFSISFSAVFSLPSSVARTVLTVQGTVFDTLQSPWISGYQVASNIPYGDLIISLATVFEGNWQTWSLRTEAEKENLNEYDFTARRITSTTAFSGVPVDLVTYMLSPNYLGFYWARSSTLGSYAWSLSPYSGVNLLTIQTRMSVSLVGGYPWLLPPYPDVTPRWNHFYTIYTDGPDPLNPEIGCVVTTVTADKILGVIDFLHEEKNPLGITRVFNTRPEYYTIGGYADVDATHIDDRTVPPSTVYDFDQDDDTKNVVLMLLGELIGYPNRWSVPRARIDTIMFHGPLGVYSWSRKYGIKADLSCRLVHFSETGLVLVPCVMPDEVVTYGVCPNISYAGNDQFLCSCEKVCTETLTDFMGPEVVKIYTGSPFAGWEALPMPSVGRLVHVRPAQVTSARVVLLGVVELPATEAEPITYYVTFLDRLNAVGEWSQGAKIPQDYDVTNTWDVSVYGNGEYVQMMQEYLSKPPVVANRVYFSKAVYEFKELK